MKNSGKYYRVEQANFSTLYFRNLLSNCKVKFFITCMIINFKMILSRKYVVIQFYSWFKF